MAWFTPDFNRFFKDLAANNNKEWFDANRQRYEVSVKKPFELFVAEVIKRVAKLDPQVRIEPKDAIFRINRDVRFSKEKAPYKLNRSALVSAEGRKALSGAGIYFELGPEHVAFYGGAYMPEKEELHRLRTRIAADTSKFKKLCADKEFVKFFGRVQGERNKRLPPEFQEASEREPLLFNKQFYYGAELPASMVTSPKLPDVLMEHYAAMVPLNKFLMG
ncbi:MAG: DUF2461 domain-containing protein [Flavobacteriales bacterium]|nr:DUF2461 domain-containing protein [Flavobacteriales bacterium]MBP9080203.1 DUF2461 domain-containing protein [Flavobacteriales bacterium]